MVLNFSSLCHLLKVEPYINVLSLLDLTFFFYKMRMIGQLLPPRVFVRTNMFKHLEHVTVIITMQCGESCALVKPQKQTWTTNYPHIFWPWSVTASVNELCTLSSTQSDWGASLCALPLLAGGQASDLSTLGTFEPEVATKGGQFIQKALLMLPWKLILFPTFPPHPSVKSLLLRRFLRETSRHPRKHLKHSNQGLRLSVQSLSYSMQILSLELVKCCNSM